MTIAPADADRLISALKEVAAQARDPEERESIGTSGFLDNAAKDLEPFFRTSESIASQRFSVANSSNPKLQEIIPCDQSLRILEAVTYLFRCCRNLCAQCLPNQNLFLESGLMPRLTSLQRRIARSLSSYISSTKQPIDIDAAPASEDAAIARKCLLLLHAAWQSFANAIVKHDQNRDFIISVSFPHDFRELFLIQDLELNAIITMVLYNSVLNTHDHQSTLLKPSSTDILVRIIRQSAHSSSLSSHFTSFLKDPSRSFSTFSDEKSEKMSSLAIARIELTDWSRLLLDALFSSNGQHIISIVDRCSDVNDSLSLLILMDRLRQFVGQLSAASSSPEHIESMFGSISSVFTMFVSRAKEDDEAIDICSLYSLLLMMDILSDLHPIYVSKKKEVKGSAELTHLLCFWLKKSFEMSPPADEAKRGKGAAAPESAGPEGTVPMSTRRIEDLETPFLSEVHKQSGLFVCGIQDEIERSEDGKQQKKKGYKIHSPLDADAEDSESHEDEGEVRTALGEAEKLRRENPLEFEEKMLSRASVLMLHDLISADAPKSYGATVALAVRSRIIRLLGNLCHQRSDLQDEIVKSNAMAHILGCTFLDDRNPLIQEWSILAIRNLADGSELARQLIASLQVSRDGGATSASSSSS